MSVEERKKRGWDCNFFSMFVIFTEMTALGWRETETFGAAHC